MKRRRPQRSIAGPLLWALGLIAGGMLTPDAGEAASAFEFPARTLEASAPGGSDGAQAQWLGDPLWKAEPETAERPAARPGDFCPLGACRPPRAAPVSHAAAFAFVALGAGWLARRRGGPGH